jgi:hypothetical protein
MTKPWLWLLGLSLAWHATSAVADAAPLRRFAITVSANDGGPTREPLRYAESDALALSQVLQQLGGVDPRDARHLHQPSLSALQTAFLELTAQLREAERNGARTEAVFYFSGHSDESALLLRGERLGYAALRQLLDALPARVRIAILDSCASGAFTRQKGGVVRPPFMVDASTDVRGHAFLTSSSADESAQESDRIAGSFFTHYLVSGLRGAADASGDRKITLTEAYRFAFEETLARTAPTQFGSQHPAYEIRLAGTGDLVMTDLRSTQAELILGEDVEGRVFVWEPPRKLLVEVDKPRGRKLLLALPPHDYRVELSRGALFFTAELRALVGKPLIVTKSAFASVARESTLARGAVAPFALQPFGAGIIPPFSTTHRARELSRHPVRNYVNVSLLFDDPDAIAGLQLGLFGVRARHYLHGLQAGTFFNDAGELLGVQLSGLVNVTRSYGWGMQLAGAINYAGHELRGMQLSFGVNYAEAERGAQLAGGVNVALDTMHGVQVGAANWARSAQGVQVGAVNLARRVDGLQLGGLNVAAGRVRGAQLGLINYADEADFSIGLLGITRQGGTHLQIAVDELMAPEIALRLDAKYNYSFVSVGMTPYRKEARGYAVGAGLGAKAPLPLTGLWLDIDLGFHMLQPSTDFHRGVPNSLWRMRVLVRYELARHLSVFAGLTVNVLLQLDEGERYRPLPWVRTHQLTRADAAERVLLWPGFAAGIRL